MVAVDQMADDDVKDISIELLEKEEACLLVMRALTPTMILTLTSSLEEACLIAMEQWAAAMAQALHAAQDRQEVAFAFVSLAATMRPMQDGPDMDKVVRAVQSHGAKAYASLATWEANAAEADALRAAAEVQTVLFKLAVEESFTEAAFRCEENEFRVKKELRISRLQAVLCAKQDWAEAKRLLAANVKEKAKVAEVGTRIASLAEKELVLAMMAEIESMTAEAAAACALAEKKVVMALVFAEGIGLESLASYIQGQQALQQHPTGPGFSPLVIAMRLWRQFMGRKLRAEIARLLVAWREGMREELEEEDIQSQSAYRSKVDAMLLSRLSAMLCGEGAREAILAWRLQASTGTVREEMLELASIEVQEAVADVALGFGSDMKKAACQRVGRVLGSFLISATQSCLNTWRLGYTREQVEVEVDWKVAQAALGVQRTMVKRALTRIFLGQEDSSQRLVIHAWRANTQAEQESEVGNTIAELESASDQVKAGMAQQQQAMRDKVLRSARASLAGLRFGELGLRFNFWRNNASVGLAPVFIDIPVTATATTAAGSSDPPSPTVGTKSKLFGAIRRKVGKPASGTSDGDGGMATKASMSPAAGAAALAAMAPDEQATALAGMLPNDRAMAFAVMLPEQRTAALAGMSSKERQATLAAEARSRLLMEGSLPVDMAQVEACKRVGRVLQTMGYAEDVKKQAIRVMLWSMNAAAAAAATETTAAAAPTQATAGEGQVDSIEDAIGPVNAAGSGEGGKGDDVAVSTAATAADRSAADEEFYSTHEQDTSDATWVDSGGRVRLNPKFAAKVKRLFELCDADGSGQIDLEEFVMVCTGYEPQLSQDGLEKTFNECGAGDGIMDADEFSMWVASIFKGLSEEADLPLISYFFHTCFHLSCVFLPCFHPLPSVCRNLLLGLRQFVLSIVIAVFVSLEIVP